MSNPNSTLTAARLRGLLDYDPATGILAWRVNKSNARAGQVAGSATRDGHLRIKIDRAYHYAHRLAWLHAHGDWPPQEIDHINRIPSDNRLVNLRLADRAVNNLNRGKPSSNTSGIKGVYWNKANGKWLASMRRSYLGSFATIEEAAAARREAEAAG